MSAKRKATAIMQHHKYDWLRSQFKERFDFSITTDEKDENKYNKSDRKIRPNLLAGIESLVIIEAFIYPESELVYRRSPKLQTTEKREAPPVTRPLPLKMPRLLLTMSLRRAGSHPRAFDEIQHLYELELGIKLRREVRLQRTR
ncbi:hypothetical protein HZH66_002716 [Vespula vulgaris]|uniref:Uncharacterized protein n=1 Tax=Vespula vulgaris TaxID=7454 RepID=A0A834KNM5_VESVU|nr:hypothetical protein HZH66_002716 [Vespula vulgaris]